MKDDAVQAGAQPQINQGNLGEQAPVTNQAQAYGLAEHTIPQSKVNEIVGAAKRDAYERGKAEALALAQHAAKVQEKAESQAPALGVTDFEKLLDDRMEQFAADQAARLEKQEADKYANHVLTEMAQKTQAAKAKHSDYDEKLASVNGFQEVPEIYALANMVDNGGEVLYHFADNPSKVGILLNLSSRSPSLAKKEITRLSESLKNVEHAAKSKDASAPEPLQRIQGSPSGIDNGEATVSDYRKQFSRR